MLIIIGKYNGTSSASKSPYNSLKGNETLLFFIASIIIVQFLLLLKWTKLISILPNKNFARVDTDLHIICSYSINFKLFINDR